MKRAVDGNFDHGTIDGKKEKLVMDLSCMLADTDDVLKEVANLAAEEFEKFKALARISARIQISPSGLHSSPEW